MEPKTIDGQPAPSSTAPPPRWCRSGQYLFFVKDRRAPSRVFRLREWMYCLNGYDFDFLRIQDQSANTRPQVI